MRHDLKAVAVSLTALACLAAAAGACASRLGTGGGAVSMSVRVSGTGLVDGGGRPVRLLGVNRSGTEYACAQGWGIFDGPATGTSIVAMRSWKIGAVAIPLSEACWLGLPGIAANRGGAAYRRAIQGYVHRLELHGIYPILRLSTAAPGAHVNDGTKGEIRMADADHAPAFWKSVAATFRDDHAVVFDVYDEPHDLPDWNCWLDGCRITGDPLLDRSGQPVGDYEAVGMQQLVDAVRSTGATQPIMIAGMDYAGDMSGWLAHEPRDPRKQLIASFHTFEDQPHNPSCDAACLAAAVAVGKRVPVVIDGFGDYDCDHDYTDAVMRLGDAHGFSYLAWTWDTWGCQNGLISSYDGTPTAFGIGVRDHLRQVGR